MKKTFKLTHPKIKVDRLVEAARSDVRKYLKRERKKELPEGSDFWDFDCRCGTSPVHAKVIHVNDIGKALSDAAEQGLETLYVEIIARPGHRTKKPQMGPKTRD